MYLVTLTGTRDDVPVKLFSNEPDVRAWLCVHRIEQALTDPVVLSAIAANGGVGPEDAEYVHGYNVYRFDETGESAGSVRVWPPTFEDDRIVDLSYAAAKAVGLRGIGKLRFAIGNRGKRGGGRAVYFLMLAEDTAIMLFAYAKNEKEDLSAAEKKSALALISEMLDGQE